MKRRWFAVLGGASVLLWVGFVVSFGLDGLADPLGGLRAMLFLLGGVLLTLGGLEVSVAGREWYQLVGLGNVAFGLALAVQLPYALAGGWAGVGYGFVAAVGGLSLAFIGADWVRGGRHFDLAAYESGPLLG